MHLVVKLQVLSLKSTLTFSTERRGCDRVERSDRFYWDGKGKNALERKWIERIYAEFAPQLPLVVRRGVQCVRIMPRASTDRQALESWEGNIAAGLPASSPGSRPHGYILA